LLNVLCNCHKHQNYNKLKQRKTRENIPRLVLMTGMVLGKCVGE